jgi:hypothetical protein
VMKSFRPGNGKRIRQAYHPRLLHPLSATCM